MLSRRGFLIVPASALGLGGATPPSDRLSMGAIGLGPRGMYDLDHFMRQDDVRVVAVADCFEERRAEGKATVDKRYGNPGCKAYRFHEELLDRRDIDAVLIAAGDRWHSVLSVLAASA